MEGRNRFWRLYLQFSAPLPATPFLFFFMYHGTGLSVLRGEEVGKIKQGGAHKDPCFRKVLIYLMKIYPKAALQTHLLPCSLWGICSYLVIRKFEMREEGAASYIINQGDVKEPFIAKRLVEFG